MIQHINILNDCATYSNIPTFPNHDCAIIVACPGIYIVPNEAQAEVTILLIHLITFFSLYIFIPT